MLRYFTILFLPIFFLQDEAVSKVRKKAPPGMQTRSRTAEPPVTFDPAAVNDAAAMQPLELKDEGSAALRAQILLDRAHFSPGEIDGRIGMNTLRALAGFRAARGLPPGETFDEPVWKALNADTAPALISYRIAKDDLKGPFVRVPADMMEKANLQYLGYASPVEGLAEKFHVSPALLSKLNPGVSLRSEGEEILVPNVLTTLQAAAANVVVSKSTSTVAAFDKEGKLIAQYPCTSGSSHDPLPIGDWKITGIYRNPHFSYNPDLFWDADPSHAKAKIPPGPNSPVGLVWIDLSKEHYGIHGTPEPSKIGYTQSHGCIRLTNWDALELADLVSKGLPALLRE